MRSNSGKTKSFGHGRPQRAELSGAVLRSAGEARRSVRPSRAAPVAAPRSREAGPPSSHPQLECASPKTWNSMLTFELIRGSQKVVTKTIQHTRNEVVFEKFPG